VKVLAGCAAAAIALSTTAPAEATPFVRLVVQAGAGVLGRPGDSEAFELFGTTELLATSANATVNEPITSTSNFAVGGSSSGNVRLGSIGGSAGGDIQSTHTGTLTFLQDNLAGGSGSMLGEFRIDDLVVTHLAGNGPATVPILLNLDLSGSLGAGGSLNSPGFDWPAGAGGTASIFVSVTTQALTGQAFSGTRSYFNNNRNEESFSSTGLLAGGDALATSPFEVQVGTPFTVILAMGVSAGASTNITHGNAMATASFSNTLSFPTNRPVFTVPDGYTVNSVSAGIVNNRFGLFQIPEPSTLALLFVGSILLAGARRNRSSPAESRRASR
jgi:hypothetical protein